MFRKAVSLLTIIGLAGCAGVDHVGPEISVPLAAQGAVSRAVANQMKDPNSSEFRNWHAFQSDKGILICGEVNSKNGFGGYVGFMHFVAHASAEGRLLTPVAVVPSTSAGPDPMVDGIWQRYYPGCY